MFTHVPACMVAELLSAALCHRGASVHVVTSMSRPGCYQPKATIVEWDSHPLGKRAFPRRTERSGLDMRSGNPCDWAVPVLGPRNDIVTHRQALPHKDVA